MSDFKIAIVGSGIITEFLISTALKKANADTSKILVFSEDKSRLENLREQYNVNTTDDPTKLSEMSTIVLAMYDREASQILPKISKSIQSNSIVLSLIIDWNLPKLEVFFPTQALIRLVMTPSIVNCEGIVAYVTGKNQAIDAENFAQVIFSRVGKVIKVETESELETVAEVFLAGTVSSLFAVTSMIRGAMRAGLSESRAKEIAAQIFQGNVQIETQPDEVVQDLRKKILADQTRTVFIEQGIALINKYGMWNFLRI